MAIRNGACKLAKDPIYTWQSLARLFFSPQGMEFCSKKSFPKLNIWKRITQQCDTRALCIYVDEKQKVSDLKNKHQIALIGNTCAELRYDKVGKYTVVLMHGAKASIIASNYAVLNIVNIGNCDVKMDIDNTVVVL